MNINKKHMSFIKKFKELSAQSSLIAGGKGASLGEMTQAGIPVPPGFVVLAKAFDEFLQETDINVEIDVIIEKIDTKKIHTVENASEQIKTLILSREIPKHIEKQILTEYKNLKSPFVAVRSSATAEDSAAAAWAGQLDSFLNTGQKNLIENIKKCWASLFTPRAIFYRFEKGLEKDKISVAVVVQKMVQSEQSGIAFSVHPVTEDENQIIIEAGFGLGEAIVSGAITPDSYVVDKRGFEILDININKQIRALYKNGTKGNMWKKLGAKGGNQVLTRKEIVELTKIIMGIEYHYGIPQDIEWAKEKNKFYITQSRPITTLSKEIKILKKENMIKVFNRAETLLSCEIHDLGERIELPKVCNNRFFMDPCFVKIPKKGTDVYYNFSDIKQSPELLIKFYNENFETLQKQKKEFYKNCDKLRDYLADPSFNDFQKIFNNIIRIFPFVAISNMLGDERDNIKGVENKLIPIYREMRKYSDGLIHNGSLKIYDILKTKVPNKYKDSINFLKFKELSTGKYPSDKEIQNRKKGFIYHKGKLFTNISLDKYANKFNFEFVPFKPNKDTTENFFSGQSAYEGIVQGPAKIVLELDDMAKVKRGDIVVASMTTPDFVPAMKRAAAFITDEGGVTCHASIVAREMKKPCIIGTKIATQTLQDGDLIKVNADEGTIKILKSKKIKPDEEKLVLGNQDIDASMLTVEMTWRGLHDKKIKTQIGLETPSIICEYIKGRTINGYLNPKKFGLFINRCAKKIIKEKNLLKNLKIKTEAFALEARETALKNLEKINSMDHKSLANLLKTLRRCQIELSAYGTVIAFADVLGGISNQTSEIISSRKNLKYPLTIYSQVLCSPDIKSFTEQAYSKIKTSKGSSEILAKKYFWLDQGYIGRGLSKQEVRQIKKTTSNQEKLPSKNDLLKELELKDKEKRIIDIAKEFIYLKSLKADSRQFIHVVINRIVDRLAEEWNIPSMELESMTINELVSVLTSKTKVPKNLKSRLKYSVFIMNGDDYDILLGNEAQKFIKERTVVEKNKDIKEIKGQIANSGKIQGVVKLIFGPQHNHKINKGDVLVSTATSPQLLPAMRLSSAFITDVGGITSHAAIVAREMGKPCITGTKNATQILRDGDLVEVNADEGVVKIIEKEKIYLKDYGQYQKLFEWKGGGLPYLISDISMGHYKNVKGYIITFFENVWRAFLDKSNMEDTLDAGLELYSNKKNYTEFNKGFSQYFKRSESYLKKVINGDLDKENLDKSLSYMSELLFYYSKTEFFYLDRAYEYSKTDRQTKDNLKNFGELKNKGREYLNKVFIGAESYLDIILEMIAKKFSINIQDLKFYSVNDLIRLFDGKIASNNVLTKRRESYILIARGKEMDILDGKEAANLLNDFFSNAKLDDKTIKGVTANKGFVRANVMLMDYGYENFNKSNQLIKEMKKGDVLVADTTSPEIIIACNKASAILTNQGGLMSHAAIVSRELNIPCIVGLGNITDIVKTGDLVEVDANKGLVKKINEFELEFTRQASIELYYLWLNGYLEAGRMLDMDMEQLEKTFAIYENNIIKTYTPKDNIEQQKKAINQIEETKLKKRIKEYLKQFKQIKEEPTKIEDIQFARKLMANFVITFILGDIKNNRLQKIALDARIKTEKLFTILMHAQKKKLSSKKQKYCLLLKDEIIVIKNQKQIETELQKFNISIIDNRQLHSVDMDNTNKITKKLSPCKLEKIITYPLMPIIAWEYSSHGLIDNPYLKIMGLKKYPCTVEYQKNKYEYWSDESTKPITKDEKLIKKIIQDSLKFVDREKKKIKSFATYKNKNLTEKQCLRELHKLNSILKKLYQGYYFFTGEYIATEDKNLLKKLPKVRIILSDFANIVWQCYANVLNYIKLKKDYPLTKLNQCCSNEIEKILEGKNLDISNSDKRPFAILIVNNKIKKLKGEDALQIKKYLKLQNPGKYLAKKIKEERKITGNIAYPGKTRGEVVHVSADDYDNYKKILKNKNDFILITPMTRPEIVPYLKKAKAIITDEGGITCHAAIVSRELKIPCIIGTKIATRILRDGDLVEVNADKGVIKIIKKNKQ